MIKVKYGWTPEKSGEVAATRLLAALGFGADHVTMVPRLRCIGCPLFPFEMQEVAEAFYATWLLDLVSPKNQPSRLHLGGRRERKWPDAASRSTRTRAGTGMS